MMIRTEIRSMLSLLAAAGCKAVRTRMNSTVSGGRSLEGKVAIVTASTEGIGYAIAKQLGQDGAKVVISSRKQDNVLKAVNSLNQEGITQVTGVMCHVGKPEHRKNLIEKTIQQYGGIDILVSNAAANPAFGPVLQTSEQAWDKIFDINVKSAFLLCKEILPHIEARGGGSVVFVSSIAGYAAMPGLGAYSVSKTALLALKNVLATECGSAGIRVNCVAPGVIETKFSDTLTKNEAILNRIEQMTPLGRVGMPEEVSGAVSFLCSDQASYITGETIIISGGASAKL